MWVRTQDKRMLAEIVRVSVDKNFGKNKGVISGMVKGASESISGFIVLGEYQSIDKAMDELDRFQQAVAENPKGFYQFS